MGLRPSAKSTPWFLLALVAVVGCGHTDEPLLAADQAAASTTTGDAQSESSDGGTTMAPVEPSSSSGDEPGSNFIEERDGGSEWYECDPFVQDCPAGLKCMWWANDGGGSWNATKCFEIAPEPAAVGEPCTVEGSGVSGIDTCDVGAMCWDVDPETNEGTCVGLCTGDDSHPICDDPSMLCTGRGPFLCLPTCCPIEQDCPEGEACYPINDTFSCAPDASKDAGGYGDPCEFINVCDPGLMCLGADAIPDCAGSAGCCTAFCQVGSTSCTLLHPDLECVAWFEEGHAPPGEELVGACVLPQ